MPNEKVHVWYDASGRICAVGRPQSSKGAKLHVVPISGKNQSVIETEIDTSAIRELSRTHLVNSRTKALVRR